MQIHDTELDGTVYGEEKPRVLVMLRSGGAEEVALLDFTEFVLAMVCWLLPAACACAVGVPAK